MRFCFYKDFTIYAISEDWLKVFSMARYSYSYLSIIQKDIKTMLKVDPHPDYPPEDGRYLTRKKIQPLTKKPDACS
jgi:hypothetical protein